MPKKAFHHSAMMFSENYYTILGVNKNASEKDIKKAYLELAKIHHPDNNRYNENSSAKFHEIKHAYEFLRDDKKRWPWHREKFRSCGGSFTESSEFDSDFSNRYEYQGGTPKYYQKREIGQRVRQKKPKMFWYYTAGSTDPKEEENVRRPFGTLEYSFFGAILLSIIAVPWSLMSFRELHPFYVNILKTVFAIDCKCIICSGRATGTGLFPEDIFDDDQ